MEPVILGIIIGAVIGITGSIISGFFKDRDSGDWLLGAFAGAVLGVFCGIGYNVGGVGGIFGGLFVYIVLSGIATY